MKKILIDCSEEHILTALTENDKPIEFFVDPRKKNSSWVGHIIVGRIKTILPGQFAFVDIGAKKNAFMNLQKGHGLKAGMSILVQVQKDAVGTKGMLVGQEISVKGRFMVLCASPYAPTVGVSRKIDDEKEIRRLRKILWKALPAGFSAIVRTNGAGKSAEILREEIEALRIQHEEITAHANFVRAPVTLYPVAQASPISQNLLSDILSDDISAVLINTDDDEEFSAIKKSVCEFLPTMEKRISREPLSVKKQIKNALKKETRLPCGGYITTEQTEACVVIDVNTGSNVGNTDYSTTVLQTNIEAAAVLAAVIRLRNLSGIIITDFIDMTAEQDKTAVLDALAAEIKKDRIKTELQGFIGLGMVLMTRRKTRPPLHEFFTNII